MLVFLVIFVASCSDDDDTIFTPASMTIADFVSGNDDYSSLLAALQKTELDVILNGAGTFTVFAPNNAAFTEFLDGASLDAVPTEDLKQILLNHVLGATVKSTELTTGFVQNQAVESASGANLSTYIEVTSGVVINGVSTVTTADIETDNGVIHAVDKVIPLPTILTFVGLDSSLSSLAEVATTTPGFDTDFAAVLGDSDSSLTLLAPDNAAFQTLGDISGVSTEALEQILLNHVISGVNVSSALSNSYASTLASYGDTDNNLNIYINTDSGVSFNGLSDVTEADIVASNGVIHKVSAVITLPTVVTFATADPMFSSLVAALTREPDFTFVSTLSTVGMDPAPFTVFAPNDESFGKLLTELDVPNLAAIPTDLLEQVLSYHVVTGANVRSTDLTDFQIVTTLETGTFTVNTMPDVTITDERSRMINVVSTDVQAANGVIHVVDQVLLPAAN